MLHFTFELLLTKLAKLEDSFIYLEEDTYFLEGFDGENLITINLHKTTSDLMTNRKNRLPRAIDSAIEVGALAVESYGNFSNKQYVFYKPYPKTIARYLNPELVEFKKTKTTNSIWRTALEEYEVYNTSFSSILYNMLDIRKPSKYDENINLLLDNYKHLLSLYVPELDIQLK